MSLVFNGWVTNFYFKGELYTAKVSCASLVGAAYFSSRHNSDFVCVNCGSEAFDKKAFKKLSLTYQTVFPACVVCKADEKKGTCLGKRQKTTQQRTTIQVQDLSTDDVSTPAIHFEVSSTKMKRQLSMKDFVTTAAKKNRKINDQQAEQQQEKADETHDDMIDRDA